MNTTSNPKVNLVEPIQSEIFEVKAGDPEQYFKLMRMLTKKTKDYMYSVLFPEMVSRIPEQFRISFTPFLTDFQNSRNNSNFLRPTTVYLSFKATGGVNEAFLLPAMALAEIYNSSTYIFNSILDGKRGYTTKSKIEQGTINGNLYRALTEHALADLSRLGLNSNVIETIRARVSKIDEAIYLGQYVDLNILNLSHADELILDPELYYSTLHVRNEGFSGSFYSFLPELGSLLSGASSEMTSTLAEFGRIYGHSLQLANDMGDFFLPLGFTKGNLEKPYKDVLSDLRNKRLTLPVFLALSSPNVNRKLLFSATEQEFADPKLAYELAVQISRHFWDLGVFEKVRDILRENVKEMEKLLEKVPKSPYRDFMKGQLHTSLLRNKWFKGIRDINTNNK